ncbi:MAG TPA: hypothetical protein VGD43_17310 [Micromonospora sp.]
MSEADTEIISILVSADVSEAEIDQLVELLDEGDVDAIVGPVDRRMGLPPELAQVVTWTIETSVTTLAALMVTAIGRRIWQSLTGIARRRRSKQELTSGSAPVAIVREPGNGIQLELTYDDLADPRLLRELGQLGTLAKKSEPVVMRWDRSGSGGFRVGSDGAAPTQEAS